MSQSPLVVLWLHPYRRSNRESSEDSAGHVLVTVAKGHRLQWVTLPQLARGNSAWREPLPLHAAACVAHRRRTECAGWLRQRHDRRPAYDFSEFYAATDGKAFRDLVSGNP